MSEEKPYVVARCGECGRLRYVAKVSRMEKNDWKTVTGYISTGDTMSREAVEVIHSSEFCICEE